MEKIIDRSFFLIIPSLLIGLFLGYSSFLLCILALLFRAITSDKHTVGFFLLLYGGIIGGAFRFMYPSIPIYGLLLQFLGLILMLDLFNDFKIKGITSFKYLTVMFAVFTASYLIARHTSYANSKIVDIIKTGFLVIYGYYVFCNSRIIKTEKIAQLLILMSMCYICFVKQAYSIHLVNFFDYNSFRSGLELYSKINEENTIVNYQTVGMTALYGFAMYISNKEINYLRLAFYLLMSTQLVLMSGARQAILGLFVVIFLRFAYFNSQRSQKRLLLILIGLFFLYFTINIIGSLGIEAVDNAIDSGGSGRDLVYLDCIRIIREYPLLGVGLGGYPLYSIDGAPWPHNMILEILCETGIIGFSIILILLFYYLITNKISMRANTITGNYIVLLLSALFVRVMFSSDLTEGIEIFCGIFALSSLKHVKNV